MWTFSRSVTERRFLRVLHDESAYPLQRRLRFGGPSARVLPVRVTAERARRAAGPLA